MSKALTSEDVFSSVSCSPSSSSSKAIFRFHVPRSSIGGCVCVVPVIVDVFTIVRDALGFRFRAVKVSFAYLAFSGFLLAFSAVFSLSSTLYVSACVVDASATFPEPSISSRHQGSAPIGELGGFACLGAC